MSKSWVEAKNETKETMRDIAQNIRHCAWRRFLQQECGATAIEYALIAGGISIGIIVAVTSVGTTLNTVYYDKLLNLF